MVWEVTLHACTCERGQVEIILNSITFLVNCRYVIKYIAWLLCGVMSSRLKTHWRQLTLSREYQLAIHVHANLGRENVMLHAVHASSELTT